MRGHFSVGFQSREEGGERREKCVDTLQWASKVGSREEGGGRREECVVTVQWASKVGSRE